MSKLSDKLTRLREENGWSKTYVAKKLGLKNMQTYANYEYDSREPDLELLKKISEIYNVSTDYLLGRTEDPTATLNDEIDDMLDSAMTRDGKPLSNNDRNVIRGMIEAYLKNKE